MKVLVTGHRGFLGSRVMRLAQELGIDARGMWLGVDVADDADVIIHCAGRTSGVGEALPRGAEFLEANAQLTWAVCREAKRLGAYVVAAGSVCSYPESAPQPFREDWLWRGLPELTNRAYGVAKRLITVAAPAFGVRCSTLVLANLYGPGDRSTHVLPDMVRKLREGSGPCRFYAPHTSREFLHVEDAAAALLEAAIRGAPEVMNVGSGDVISMHDVGVRLRDMLAPERPIVWDESGPAGQEHRLLDSSLARGWGLVTRPFDLAEVIRDDR